LLGDPDDSISGRTGRAAIYYQYNHHKVWSFWFLNIQEPFINFLFSAYERNHTRKSVQPELQLEREIWSWCPKGTQNCDVNIKRKQYL
jgi:hypothetical protein